jgi:hypothetical protein
MEDSARQSEMAREKADLFRENLMAGRLFKW